ncbi:hypothetical protein R1flu_004724 [Riccia fluitans]|uniref:Uncharacterized protein n=1 Tax=Riccia fluitans TaxID=41844 RepID=A0ABD1YR45_9MARC
MMNDHRGEYDTGFTSTTRRTAARQIGEIAKLHPTELRPLLRQVRQFLRSKSWDTRVAAAQAIRAIAENVSHPTMKDIYTKAEVRQKAEKNAVQCSTFTGSSLGFKFMVNKPMSRSFTISQFEQSSSVSNLSLSYGRFTYHLSELSKQAAWRAQDSVIPTPSKSEVAQSQS